MCIKGLFITALAALTANAAKVRQMTIEPATYVQTDTAAESLFGGSSSCDDDSYCFRNTGCISTRWDQQIQETHNPSMMNDDFCVTIDSFLCPDCVCDTAP